MAAISHFMPRRPNRLRHRSPRGSQVASDMSRFQLLDGSVHLRSDLPISPLPESTQEQVQSFLQQRAEHVGKGVQGQELFYDALREVYGQMDNSQSLSNLTLGSATGFIPVPSQVEAAISALSSGLSRVACLLVFIVKWPHSGVTSGRN